MRWLAFLPHPPTDDRVNCHVDKANFLLPEAKKPFLLPLFELKVNSLSGRSESFSSFLRPFLAAAEEVEMEKPLLPPGPFVRIRNISCGINDTVGRPRARSGRRRRRRRSAVSVRYSRRNAPPSRSRRRASDR